MQFSNPESICTILFSKMQFFTPFSRCQEMVCTPKAFSYHQKLVLKGFAEDKKPYYGLVSWHIFGWQLWPLHFDFGTLRI